MTKGSIFGLLVMLGQPGVGVGVGQASTTNDPDTGLKSWKWAHGGISLQLVQWLSDQTRAFFEARGFSAGDYNWGMTSYGLAPGAKFDLLIVRYVAGSKITGRINRIECAGDL